MLADDGGRLGFHAIRRRLYPADDGWQSQGRRLDDRNQVAQIRTPGIVGRRIGNIIVGTTIDRARLVAAVAWDYGATTQ